MGRIRYGISNLHYADATEGTGGALTYATPSAVPGCKSISFDPAGDSFTDYADNTVWYSGNVNQGYTGSIEFEDTAAADAFLADVLSSTTDATTGATIEKSTDVQKECALLWQFELAGGTETGKRGCFVRCVISRPSGNGQTKENGITVATNTVNFTAMPRLSDNVVKGSLTSDKTGYSAWFDAVAI